MKASKEGGRIFLNSAYGIALVILLIIALSVYQSFETLLEKSFWVSHTNQVRYSSALLLSSLKDAETSQRGYLLTADSLYLEPYVSSLTQIPSYLTRLDSLTSDNALQQKRIKDLSQLIDKRLEIIAASLALDVRHADPALIRTFLITHQGKQIMDKIRVSIGAIIAQEEELLASRSKQLDRSVRLTQFIIFLTVFSSFFLAILSYLASKRQLAKREAYQRDLDRLNRQLATANEELQVRNEQLATTNEELLASNEEVAAGNEELLSTNEELKQVQQKLITSNHELDKKVEERTNELAAASHQIALLLENERAAHHSVQLERSRLYNLFMQAPALICVVRGEEFIYELANPLYLQTLGLQESIKGKSLKEVMPDLAPSLVSILRDVFRKGERFIGKELPITLDWERNGMPYNKYFNLVYEPLRKASGEVEGLITFGYEITEQIKARQQALESAHLLDASNKELVVKNEQLQKINTDLDNFIYTASHDLKSPVANLEGLIKQLGKRTEHKLDVLEKNLLSYMDHSITKLKQTIRDLTQIAKTQKESDEMAEYVLFKDILWEVEEELSAQIQEAAAIVEEKIGVEGIFFAKRNIRSILYNLLSNAIKYRSPDRRVCIRISTQQSDGFVVLSFKDNGLGIKEGQADKIFLMFKRLHTHVEGTGIGLYIVKRIIENAGGKIELESKEGEGTTFKLYFKQQ